MQIARMVLTRLIPSIFFLGIGAFPLAPILDGKSIRRLTFRG